MVSQIRLQPSLRRVAFAAIATCLILASMSIATERASAASYQYCNNCLIYSNGSRPSGADKFATRAYIRRLSGPTANNAVPISTWAVNSNGFGCQTGQQWARETWCNISQVIPQLYYATAFNHGPGNYNFNAHLSW